MKTGLALLDFGGPQRREELVPFLTELLKDVLPGPPWLKGVAAPWLAQARSRTVASGYERIGWSPLVPTHRRQAAGLMTALADLKLASASGMMFTAPTMDQAVSELLDQGVERLVVLPLFPHFSFATTGAAFTFFWEALVRAKANHLPIQWIPAWFEEPTYLAAVAETIRATAEALPGEGPVHLVFSPHGLPLSFLRRQDPYPDQIRATVRGVVRHLAWTDPWHVAWQSRVGPVKWIEPNTIDFVQTLGRSGARRVLLVPIAFLAEHIETLYELDVEVKEAAHHAGVLHVGRAPALGDHPALIATLAQLVRGALASFGAHHCSRCLVPRPDEARRRKVCPSCGFRHADWQVSSLT